MKAFVCLLGAILFLGLALVNLEEPGYIWASISFGIITIVLVIWDLFQPPATVALPIRILHDKPDATIDPDIQVAVSRQTLEALSEQYSDSHAHVPAGPELALGTDDLATVEGGQGPSQLPESLASPKEADGETGVVADPYANAGTVPPFDDSSQAQAPHLDPALAEQQLRDLDDQPFEFLSSSIVVPRVDDSSSTAREDDSENADGLIRSNGSHLVPPSRAFNRLEHELPPRGRDGRVLPAPNVYDPSRFEGSLTDAKGNPKRIPVRSNRLDFAFGDYAQSVTPADSDAKGETAPKRPIPPPRRRSPLFEKPDS